MINDEVKKNLPKIAQDVLCWFVMVYVPDLQWVHLVPMKVATDATRKTNRYAFGLFQS